jgi:hypothetical protein
MESKPEENPDEQYFRDSNWVAFNGGYIHSNNGDIVSMSRAAKALTKQQSFSTSPNLLSSTGSPVIARFSNKL